MERAKTAHLLTKRYNDISYLLINLDANCPRDIPRWTLIPNQTSVAGNGNTRNLESPAAILQGRRTRDVFRSSLHYGFQAPSLSFKGQLAYQLPSLAISTAQTHSQASPWIHAKPLSLMAHLVPAAGRTVCLPKARSLLLRLSPVHGNRPSSFSSPFPYSLPSRFASFPTLIPFILFSILSSLVYYSRTLIFSPSTRSRSPFSLYSTPPLPRSHQILTQSQGLDVSFPNRLDLLRRSLPSPIYFSLPFLLPLRSPSRRIRAGSFTLPPAADINPGRS
jgi:hypothetical protein